MIHLNIQKIAKFRRNLVLKNLEDNNHISKKQLKEFSASEIKLKEEK